jgi:hypothetical protein
MRKIDGSASKNQDHTSEISITNFEALVTMVQAIADVVEAKAAEIALLKQRWSTRAGGVGADIYPDDDEEFVSAMENAGFPDASMASKIEELRAEHTAQNKLLDGLYSWLASPTSLLYDPAMLRKVHLYMDKVLQMFVAVLHRNGCSIIHASYNKVLFATGKYRVKPDVLQFWESFCANVRTEKVLQPLALDDVQCLSDLFYGVMWLDPANWSGVPIDPAEGSIEWKARSSWKIVEFLPPAVRQNLVLYAGELLVVPQKELDRRITRSILGDSSEAPADVSDAVEAKAVDEEMRCADEDEDAASDAEAGPEGCMDVDADVIAEGAAAALSTDAPIEKTDIPESEIPALNSDIVDGIRDYIQGEFFLGLKHRMLKYIDDLQAQHQRELPGGLHMDTVLPGPAEDSDSGDEDGPQSAERKAERRRRHLEQKWSFPVLPGRRTIPGSLDFEFMRTLVQVLQLEDCLSEEVYFLRDEICKKIKMSNFSAGIAFENPCFPLILRDVCCPWCCSSLHIDITSHPYVKPGHWLCKNCQKTYDKDAVQARLVEMLETVIQAWQSQEITCKKCKHLQSTLMQSSCECFGRFQARFNVDDFHLVFKILQSLVVPHQLSWLGEMLDLYKHLL